MSIAGYNNGRNEIEKDIEEKSFATQIEECVSKGVMGLTPRMIFVGLMRERQAAFQKHVLGIGNELKIIRANMKELARKIGRLTGQHGSEKDILEELSLLKKNMQWTEVKMKSVGDQLKDGIFADETKSKQNQGISKKSIKSLFHTITQLNTLEMLSAMAKEEGDPVLREIITERKEDIEKKFRNRVGEIRRDAVGIPIDSISGDMQKSINLIMNAVCFGVKLPPIGELGSYTKKFDQYELDKDVEGIGALRQEIGEQKRRHSSILNEAGTVKKKNGRKMKGLKRAAKAVEVNIQNIERRCEAKIKKLRAKTDHNSRVPVRNNTVHKNNMSTLRSHLQQMEKGFELMAKHYNLLYNRTGLLILQMDDYLRDGLDSKEKNGGSNSLMFRVAHLMHIIEETRDKLHRTLAAKHLYAGVLKERAEIKNAEEQERKDREFELEKQRTDREYEAWKQELFKKYKSNYNTGMAGVVDRISKIKAFATKNVKMVIAGTLAAIVGVTTISGTIAFVRSNAYRSHKTANSIMEGGAVNPFELDEDGEIIRESTKLAYKHSNPLKLADAVAEFISDNFQHSTSAQLLSTVDLWANRKLDWGGFGGKYLLHVMMQEALKSGRHPSIKAVGLLSNSNPVGTQGVISVSNAIIVDRIVPEGQQFRPFDEDPEYRKKILAAAGIKDSPSLRMYVLGHNPTSNNSSNDEIIRALAKAKNTEWLNKNQATSIFYCLSGIYRLGTDTPNALTAFEVAKRVNPNNWVAHFGVALSHLHLSNHITSRVLFRKAVLDFPEVSKLRMYDAAYSAFLKLKPLADEAARGAIHYENLVMSGDPKSMQKYNRWVKKYEALAVKSFKGSLNDRLGKSWISAMGFETRRRFRLLSDAGKKPNTTEITKDVLEDMLKILDKIHVISSGTNHSHKVNGTVTRRLFVKFSDKHRVKNDESPDSKPQITEDGRDGGWVTMRNFSPARVAIGVESGTIYITHENGENHVPAKPTYARDLMKNGVCVIVNVSDLANDSIFPILINDESKPIDTYVVVVDKDISEANLSKVPRHVTQIISLTRTRTYGGRPVFRSYERDGEWVGAFVGETILPQATELEKAKANNGRMSQMLKHDSRETADNTETE